MPCRHHTSRHLATTRRPFAWRSHWQIVATICLVLSGQSIIHAALPNIILCMADDQGWGDTAYNGHPVLKTPHLDDMAASGLRFDRFYAAAPVCSPTRGSVLTGRHPNRFGCFSWGRSLRPQEITIAERLRAAGYATGHFGKWHIGSVLKDSPVNPSNSGFDQWLSAFNFYDNDPVLSHNGKAIEIKGESSLVAADAAIEFMRESVRTAKPFFAVVWFGSPHSPHRAEEEDRAHYEGKKDADWLGEITGLDRAVGKLRESLVDLEVSNNTLFWYTSDNGGLKQASSGGRGKKGSIYEGGLRVPAIIEWPDRIKVARTSELPANTVDIYPTLLEIAHCKQGADQPVLDGISLVSQIDGNTSLQRTKPMGFWDFKERGFGTPSDKWMREELAAQQAGKDYHDPARLMADAAQITTTHPRDHRPGHAAWLDYPWKLHRITNKKKQAKQAESQDATHPKQVTFELYDLSVDPRETQDLAREQPQRTTRMQQALDQWQTSVINSLNGDDY